MSEDEVRKWKGLLKALKDPDFFLASLKDLVVERHYSYLDVACVNSVWEEWELDSVFKDSGANRLVRISTVARILTINRCIEPQAKSQTPEWFESTALQWIIDVRPEYINSSRIFRELSVIESHKEEICEFLFNKIKKKSPNGMIKVYYDLSSTTFSGYRCILAKWGHCKEGYYYHVVLALVVTQDGFPFYWEVLPGGTADSKTISWLMSRLKQRFKILEVTLVFDRGMVSDDNLSMLEDAGIKYITAMDKNQIQGITCLDFKQFLNFKSEKVIHQIEKLDEFQKLNDITYFREIKVENKRRYILCFNPQLFKDQRKARKQAIEDFYSFVKTMNTELHEAQKSRQKVATYKKFQNQISKKKLTEFVDVTLSKTYLEKESSDSKKTVKILTYQATPIIDDEKMKYAGRLDGFWLLVTNHSEKEDENFLISPEDAINPYREKNMIESAFRDIKSFIEIEPVHVWTEAHVKAHYTICVLSYLINHTISLRLHEHEGDLTKKVISHKKAYKLLSACKYDSIEVENIGSNTYNFTKTTKAQKELLARFGMTRLVGRNAVELLNKKSQRK